MEGLIERRMMVNRWMNRWKKVWEERWVDIEELVDRWKEE